MKKILLLVLISTSSFAALPSYRFDPNQCGLNYPKKSELRDEVPNAAFHRTNYRDDFWPLVCKSTGRYNVPETHLSQILEFAPSGSLNMAQEYTFKKARVAAGRRGENLRMGECAFADRALNNDEPDSIKDYRVSEYTQVVFDKDTQSTGRNTQNTSVKTDYDRVMEEPFTFYIYVKASGGGSDKYFSTIPICEVRPLGVYGLTYQML